MLGLMLLLAAPDGASALMHTARGKLSGACTTPGCGEPLRRSRFRIDSDPDTALDSKARAFRDTGVDCRTVGAKMCTSRGRTLLSTDFTDWP